VYPPESVRPNRVLKTLGDMLLLSLSERAR
jgi:hypothetical protein